MLSFIPTLIVSQATMVYRLPAISLHTAIALIFPCIDTLFVLFPVQLKGLYSIHKQFSKDLFLDWNGSLIVQLVCYPLSGLEIILHCPLKNIYLPTLSIYYLYIHRCMFLSLLVRGGLMEI